MRTRLLLSAFIAVASVGAVSVPAQAGVPGWSRSIRRVRLDIFTCQLSLADAIQSVTGTTPVTTRIDNNYYEVRGFVGSAAIFGYCAASDVNICPNRPQADLTLLSFSGSGSGDASAKRSAVDSTFGNPILIDCN